MSAGIDRLQFYKAADGWRWRYISGNGRVLADSGQAYRRRIDAQKGAARVCGVASLAEGLNRYGAEVLVEVQP